MTDFNDLDKTLKAEMQRLSMRKAQASDVEQKIYLSVVIEIFSRNITKPHGVNDGQPDYEQIAKDATELAKTATPFLLQELGLK